MYFVKSVFVYNWCLISSFVVGLVQAYCIFAYTTGIAWNNFVQTNIAHWSVRDSRCCLSFRSVKSCTERCSGSRDKDITSHVNRIRADQLSQWDPYRFRYMLLMLPNAVHTDSWHRRQLLSKVLMLTAASGKLSGRLATYAATSRCMLSCPPMCDDSDSYFPGRPRGQVLVNPLHST